MTLGPESNWTIVHEYFSCCRIQYQNRFEMSSWIKAKRHHASLYLYVCLSISNNILLYVPIKILQAHNVYKTLVYIVIKWNLKIIWMSPLMLYELIWLLKGFVVQGKIRVSTRNYPVHLLYRIMLVKVLEFSTDAEIKTIKCGKQDNFTI